MAPIASLSFNCALVTGGGGGLGRAMAESLIKQGKKVIIAGRTESKLEKAAKEIGATAYYTMNTGDIPSIEGHVKKILGEHPDVDCLINNAGVQRPFQVLGGPDYDFDLGKADQEININIRGPMYLIVNFLPHFNALPDGAVIMNVSSVLGYNPTSLVNPVYNGTKAWLHFFTMNLRTQLANAKSKVKVVEIAPPTVETDLHRERANPDDNKKSKGNKSALSVEEFIEAVEAGWKENKDTIAPGPSGAVVSKWFDAYGEGYEKATS